MIEGCQSWAEIAGDASIDDAQTLCDRVKRYNEEDPEGLRDNARPGRPPMLDGERLLTVATWLEAGPDPDAGKPSRWTVADVWERVIDGFGVGYTLKDVHRLIRRLGFRHVSCGPVPPRRRSVTDSRSWRRKPFPTTCPWQTSSCTSRARSASARNGCSPRSGRGS